ncbi:hypothetical protein KA005_70285 [bacterium]|nr:hypothetical protein [bacterium]
MEGLFINIFIGLLILVLVIFIIIKYVFRVVDESESHFYSEDGSDEGSMMVSPAPRESEAYKERQSGFISSIAKKLPQIALIFLISNVMSMTFGGYISSRNAERLTMAGSALTQGDYGSAISSLFSAAKPLMKEYYRISRGNASGYNEPGFEYVGKLDGDKIWIMNHLYSSQDQDQNLKETDESYGNIIKGIDVERAMEICQERYGADLLSSQEWGLSRSFFMAAKNVREYPDIPEWSRDMHEDDDDYFFVIAKKSGIKEYAVKNDISNLENGLYIEGESLSNVGFRCSKKVKDAAGNE